MTQLPLFISDLFLDRGFLETDASYSLLFFNISSVIGRLSLGFILKVPKVPTLAPQAFGCIFAAFAATGILLSRSLTTILILMCPFGLAQGLVLASDSVVTMELFGVKHLSNGLGIAFTITGLVDAALGPTFGIYCSIFQNLIICDINR